MSTFPNKIIITIIISFTLIHSLSAQSNNWLSVGLGVEALALRDYGYSPIIYNGWQLSYYLHYTSVKTKKSDFFIFNYSNGRVNNNFDRTIDTWSASLTTFTFYHGNGQMDKRIQWGWSNVNYFQHRQHGDINNFNGRSDYFTAFGPAFRLLHPFSFAGAQFSFELRSHTQVLGFSVLPGFVTSSPRGFTGSNISGIQSFIQSIDWFVPGKAWHIAVHPGLNWQLNSGNRISINYQFEFIKLNGLHTSERIGSTFIISLISQL